MEKRLRGGGSRSCERPNLPLAPPPFLATAEKRMAGMGKKIKYGESVSCSKDWTLK